MSTLLRRGFGSTGLGTAMVPTGLRTRGLPSGPRHHQVMRVVATVTWLGVVMVLVAGLAIWLAKGAPDLPLSFAGGPLALLSVVVCSVLTLSMGTFLARRMPTNLVGWVMMVAGVALVPILPSALLVHQALEAVRPMSGLTMAVAWLMSNLSTPVAVGAFTIVLILFPDGRPSSRRWATLLVVPASGMVLLSLGSMLDRTMVWYPMLANPSAGLLDPGLGHVARLAGLAGLVASVGIATASLLDRYRDADETLRRQIRWVVLDGSLTALMVAPMLVGRYLLRPGDAVGEMLAVVAALGSATFPLMVAIAITRADLFDIDVFIGRTLVYLPLTAILAGMYAALVAFLQRVFVALTGDTSDAVIVLSTLVLAAAFTPVRQALDGVVERHFRAPRAVAAETPTSVAHGTEGPAMDVASLMSSVASQLERLEAIEARLARLDRGPGPETDPPLGSPV